MSALSLLLASCLLLALGNAEAPDRETTELSAVTVQSQSLSVTRNVSEDWADFDASMPSDDPPDGRTSPEPSSPQPGSGVTEDGEPVEWSGFETAPPGDRDDRPVPGPNRPIDPEAEPDATDFAGFDDDEDGSNEDRR